MRLKLLSAGRGRGRGRETSKRSYTGHRHSRRNGAADNDCPCHRWAAPGGYHAGRRTGESSMSVERQTRTHTHKHRERERESNNCACVPAFTFTYISPWQTGRSILDYQNQAKMLFRKLGTHSPARSSIETGPYLFQWVYTYVYSLHMGWCNLRSNKLTNLLPDMFLFIHCVVIHRTIELKMNWPVHTHTRTHTHEHTHTQLSNRERCLLPGDGW